MNSIASLLKPNFFGLAITSAMCFDFTSIISPLGDIQYATMLILY